MERTDNPFSELNIDPILGTEMLGLLGVHPEDYRGNSLKFAQVLDTISFYKQFADGVNVLQRVALKAKPGERLDRAYHYASLHKQKMEIQKQLDSLTNEISILE